MFKFFLFMIGLLTSWFVAECGTLLPNVYMASLVDSLINFAPSYKKLIITYAFNFSELVFSFVIVFIILLVLIKLFRKEFIESKKFYLFGNISSYLLILFFTLFLFEYDKEGIILFIEKLLFSLVGIVSAWFIIVRNLVKT